MPPRSPPVPLPPLRRRPHHSYLLPSARGPDSPAPNLTWPHRRRAAHIGPRGWLRYPVLEAGQAPSGPRGPYSQRPRCRGRALARRHILLGNTTLEKAFLQGRIMQNGFGVYRVTDICVQGDHTWIGMPQRLQGHAIGATRTILPWVSIYSCPQRWSVSRKFRT